MEPSEAQVLPGQDQTMAETALPASNTAGLNEQSALANNSIKDGIASTTMVVPPVDAPAPPKPNGVTSHESASLPVSNPHPAESGTQAREDVLASSVPAISAIMNENDLTPKPDAIPALPIPAAESADPAVQQPVSDLRSRTEPTSEERATEIKEAKEQTDLQSDRELATGLTASNDAPIERTLTPARETLLTEPTATENLVSTEATGADLPHRTPPNGASATAAEEPIPAEPAPTPVVPAATAPLTADAASADPVPKPIDQDWEMVDAPSPVKVPRPREEEEEDEPATKRHKAEASPAAADEPMTDATAEPPAPKPPTTETPAEQPAPPQTSETPLDESAMQVESTSKPAETPASAEAAPASAAAAEPLLSPYVRKSGKPEFDKTITIPQKKALQKIISNVKRGQHAPAFKEPVNWEALNIPTYPDVIKNPMDLKTMESKVKENTYQTVNEFIADFDQIVINTETFNGLAHGVTKHGHELAKSFEKQLSLIPSVEFVEPPPPDKKGKRRDSGDATRSRRRESRSSIGGAAAVSSPVVASTGIAKSPTAASPASPAFALKEGGLPQIRRGSENNPDGRPRREIHPPAPKDLPYSAQKPRKKKFAAELRFCQKVLNDLASPKNYSSNYPFLTPVDPVAMNLPTYRKIVKKPMDISTIQAKLKKNEYEEAKDFENDVRLMLANCFKFNVEGDGVYRSGQSLERIFNDLWDEKKEWLKKNAPKSGGGSPASDSEGSEAEDDEDAEADDEGDEEQARITQLEAQIQEMSRHLEQMRKTSDPGPKKKQRSKSTSKASGKDTGSSSKKKSGGKSDKKSSSKSKKKESYVTYEQKQDISERINTLPPAQMNQALKVIRDNMPSLKGAQEDEIELDIDELPNSVLLKLLMFVRKYAPKPEDPVEAKAAPKPAASTKPKKNKPMGKVEQEARIKELREKLAGNAGGMSPDEESQSGGRGPGAVDSSGDEDDDSEESEED